MEKIVESKGKSFWDGMKLWKVALARERCGKMSWRGAHDGVAPDGTKEIQNPAVIAADMGHNVVMTPTEFVYLDYMQSDKIMEPHVYASLRLNKVYSFDPMPAGLNSNEQKYILGAQGNLWTEQVYTFRQVQYMTWPRAFAVAEDTWSPNESKNWDDFVRRVEAQFKRFNVAEIK